MDVYREAEATFNYRMGVIKGQATAGSASSKALNTDDWKTSLAL